MNDGSGRDPQEFRSAKNWLARYIACLLVLTLWLDTPMAQDDADLLLLIPSIIAKSTNTSQQFSLNSRTIKFGPSDSEAELIARGVASVKVASRTIYIGTQQKSPINQDPILRAFDSNSSAGNWTRTDFETTGADGRGVSLLAFGSRLYASFTVDGTQGQPAEDFRRASQGASPAWLRSYGAGGGAKASVVAEIDPSSGTLLNAVYLTAVLSNGRSNTLLVQGMRINFSGNLEVSAESFFSPRSVDGSPLVRQNNGSSPFNYTLELTPDLQRAISATSSDF